MKILVIGGTGFLGTRLIPLLAQEHTVAVFHRGKTSLNNRAGLHTIHGEQAHLENYQRQFALTAVQQLAQAAQWPGTIRVTSTKGLPTDLSQTFQSTTINTSQHLNVDNSKIKSELGYSNVVTREKAFQATYQWLA